MFGPSIPILCYHRVGVAGGMGLELFRSHLETITELGFTVIPLARAASIVAGQTPALRRAVVLSFDDCTLDHLLYAAPELARRNMPGAFMAISGFAADIPRRDQGQEDQRLPGCLPEHGGDPFGAALRGDTRGFLSAQELAAMEADYGQTVHAHSTRHQACFRSLRRQGTLGDGTAHWSAAGVYYPQGAPACAPRWLPTFPHASAHAYDGFWPSAPGPDAPSWFPPAIHRRGTAQRAAFCLDDARRCKARLEEILGRTEDIWCWPWGQFDDVAEAAIRQAGFRAALTLERGANAPGGDPMRLTRIGVGHTKGPAWLRSRLWMYSGRVRASFFFKRFVKRPEPSGVLYVTHSDKASGGSRQMVNNALALSQAGLDVAVLCPAQTSYVEELRAAGVRVEPLPGKGGLTLARRIRDLTRQAGLPVVHAFHGRSGRAAMLARWLRMLDGGRLQVFFNRGVIFAPSRMYALWAWLGAGIIGNSALVRRQMLAAGVPQERAHVVLNAFVAPPLPPAEREPGLVLTVSDASAHKALDVFLSMARQVRFLRPQGARLTVAGSPRQEAEAVFGSQADYAEYLGRLPHAEVVGVMAKAAVVVITSRQESMPNVLLEAFATGAPVVSTAVGGIPDLIRDGVSGLLCPSQDAACLADRVVRLLDDAPLAARLGRAGQRLVTGYLRPERKAYMLLRVYSGEPVVEEIPDGLWPDAAGETNEADASGEAVCGPDAGPSA